MITSLSRSRSISSAFFEEIPSWPKTSFASGSSSSASLLPPIRVFVVPAASSARFSASLLALSCSLYFLPSASLRPSTPPTTSILRLSAYQAFSRFFLRSSRALQTVNETTRARMTAGIPIQSTFSMNILFSRILSSIISVLVVSRRDILLAVSRLSL